MNKFNFEQTALHISKKLSPENVHILRDKPLFMNCVFPLFKWITTEVNSWTICVNCFLVWYDFKEIIERRKAVNKLCNSIKSAVITLIPKDGTSDALTIGDQLPFPIPIIRLLG